MNKARLSRWIVVVFLSMALGPVQGWATCSMTAGDTIHPGKCDAQLEPPPCDYGICCTNDHGLITWKLISSNDVSGAGGSLMAGSDSLSALGSTDKSSMSDVIKVGTYEFYGSCGDTPLTAKGTDTIVKDHSPGGDGGGGGGCSGGCGGGGTFKCGDYSMGSGGGLDFRVYLGNGLRDESAGYLWINFDEPDAAIDTPDGLRLPVVRAELEVVKRANGAPRQVMGTEGYADIVSIGAHEYEIRVYRSKDLRLGNGGYNTIYLNENWNNVQPRYVSYSGGSYSYPVRAIRQYVAPEGIYEVKAGAEYLAKYRVKGNYVDSEFRSLEITRVALVNGASVTNSLVYEWNYQAGDGWILVEGTGSDVRKRSERKYQSGGCWHVEQLVKDGSDVVVSRREQTWQDFGSGLVKVGEVSGEGSTTQATYYSYTTGLLSGVVHADGAWERYEYDSQGRKTGDVSVLFNAASNAASESVRRTLYGYASLDTTNDVLLVNPASSRSVTEMVGDTVVGRTFHAYYENEGGERVEVEERCADMAAGYGSSTNLRTKKVYYRMNAEDDPGVADGRLKTVIHPDGRQDSYAYEMGTYATNADPAQCAFSASATGDCVRVSVTHGTVDATNGVAFKTTKDVKIESGTGHVVQQETYICTGSGFDRIAWVVNTLDDVGRPLKVRRSNGSQVDMSWACCGKESESDGQGGIRNYSYDTLKRVVSVEQEGTTAGEYPAQANQFTEYTYDVEGRKLTQTVRAGSLSLVTSNQYDLLGRLVSSIDPAGITTQYAQDGLTNTMTRGGVTNVTVRYLDGNTCCTLENGVVKTSYDYGVNGVGTRWTKVYTGSQGTNSPAWTKTTSDLLGRTVLEEKPGFGGTVLTNAYVYNNKGQLTSTTQQPNNLTTLFAFDSLGNQTRSGSDVNGNGTLELAGPDRINESATWFEADDSNNYWQCRASILYAGESSATPTTNSVQKTRLGGLGVSSGYGLLASESRSTDPLGNTTISRSYVDRDNRTVTQVVDYPDSTTNAQQITVNGLLVASVSKTGIQTTYTHDALGRQTSASSPSPFRGEGGGEGADGSVGSYTHYNALGQVDSTMDAASNTTTYAYDSLGRRTQVTDPLSGTTYTAYDVQGRVTNTWGSTYPVAYGYDVQGRMTEMKTLREENGTPDTTRWLYDEATGLLTNKLYADNKGPSYSYTPEGKLATRTWARGLVTSYSYDSLGQLTNISYSDSTPSLSFAYDRLGRQTTITDGQGTRTFTYNDALQLASEQSQISNQQFEITRQYDAYGRSAGFDAGTNYTVRYAFDQVGRFASVSNNVGGALRAATYSYLPGSDILAGLSNGPVQVTRSYEENRNLITQIKNSSGTTLISQYDYVNDAIGRRTSVGMTGDAFSDIGITHNKYAYNVRSELEQAKRYAGTNLSSTANAIDGQAYLYGYDLIGNRTEVYTGDMLNGSKHTYTANALNQYTQKTVPAKARIMGAAASDANVTVNNQATTRYGQYFQSYLDIANSSSAAYPLINVVGVKKNAGTNSSDVVTTATGHVFVAQTPEPFSYDDDGNLTQDGRWTYTWDAENRLIGMETLTNLPSAVPRKKLAFAYDYMSRRVEKTVSTNDSGSWILDSGFSLTYDGWNLIQEQLTSNASHLTNSYVWGLDLSGTLQGAGGIGGLLSSTTQQPSNSTTAFYLFDANGNVGQLVSTNGSILARYEYDPYGKLIKDVADVSVRNNPFRFSTKYADSETGLLYYGYRYYIPEIGRWLSRDPIGERGGRNLYRFVKNRPILRVDIFGLCEIGSTKNEQCEAKIYPWTSTPDLQTVKDELLDAIGTIEALNRLMDLAKISIAAGKSIIDAISEAAEQMNEDGWSLDAGEVAKKAKKVFDEGHGNAGGWFLSTRIKYEVCVCGQLWGTKWVDKTSAWKQFSMGVNGDFGSYDSAFQNKWEAYGRVGKACADHSAEFKGEKIP